ncbi:MAG: hypothetical protein H6851_05340 [Geminicoccaceae bacterium]|nr:hypothetical protein [Geminicoccaceae bacterium]MCB9943030.1 hypothetical protein [Geminicoccaceae bacterium]
MAGEAFVDGPDDIALIDDGECGRVGMDNPQITIDKGYPDIENFKKIQRDA